MHPTVKVQILLFLLTLCFVGTAITIHRTYQSEETLFIEGKKIEKNLHRKEQAVKKFINDSTIFKRLKSIVDDEALTETIIEEYGNKQHIYVYTYANNELSFWGSNHIVPKSDAGLPEGSSIIAWDNGWYEAYKRSDAGFSVVCLLPIKSNFPLKNIYLKDQFSGDLINSEALEVASYDDANVYNLRNLEGKYLLSLKLSNTATTGYYSSLEFCMWLFALVTLMTLITSLCHNLARRGYVKRSILLLGIFLCLVRYLDLEFEWFASRFNISLFDPRYYASSALSPSLGAFLLNVFVLTWFTLYVYGYRQELSVNLKKWGSLLIALALGIGIYFFSVGINNLFEGLIQNSSINFELTNILSLNIYSWIGILALCFVMLDFYLCLEIVIVIFLNLNLSQRIRNLIFIGLIAICIAYKLVFQGHLDISIFLWVLIFYFRGWHISRQREFNLAVFISILLAFAAIASIKQSTFQRLKQEEQQFLAIQKLESPDDPNAVLLLSDLERQLGLDPRLKHAVSIKGYDAMQLFNEEMRKLYFSGYLSRYDFSAFIFDEEGIAQNQISNRKLRYYKQRVISGSLKVSDNFYSISNDIGYVDYFGLIPITDGDQFIGTYLVELKNKSFRPLASYPDALISGQHRDLNGNNRQSSFAFYMDGELVSQQGDYLFPKTDATFSKEMNAYIRMDGEQNSDLLLYRPDAQRLLVLSSPGESWWVQLASLSFLFLVFLVFSIVINVIRWIYKSLNDYDFNFRNIRWSFLIFQNRILYSTRIQAFVVLAVVLTLVVAGIITFFSLSAQYRIQQEELTVQEVSQIGKVLESRMFREGDFKRSYSGEQEFNLAAETNSSDLNLYDTKGELVYTTQPKIYDLGLTSKFINSEAWLNLNDYSREEYYHYEQIGDLEYLVSYRPLKNDNKETVAYLSLPYFSNQQEFDKQIGVILNTLINIYALVIVALGLFAVFVANQITAPLTLVQRSLAKIKLGQTNKPIFWKRNDEIGSLIKEYNNMIVALDHSATRIMQSERESAWREMAKQVAHEIKNPLTPLRLGVQLLARAWKEKDPEFDQKFKRFSESFIEQIESLNHIASEFSNFAKMPDTKLSDVHISNVIEQAVSTYDGDTQCKIIYDKNLIKDCIVHGDADQLLRSFNNLMKNAIEARAEDRECIINIRARIDYNGYLAIEVQDNGNGIDPHVQGKMFQPNFTTKSSGTGLGLAFVKQTIETIGGTISYKTKKGKGTTFFILLPIKTSEG